MYRKSQVLAHSMLMSHPLDVLDLDKDKFYRNLDTSRCFILYSVVIHFGTNMLTFDTSELEIINIL